MKTNKVLGIVLSSAIVFSLAMATNTSALDTQSVSKASAGEIHVQGPGMYEFGDGVQLKVEPIPAGLLDYDEASRNVAGESSANSTEINHLDESDFTTVEVHVDGVGEYDLGNGVKLIIEEIPENLDDNTISPRLHESNSKLPLTGEWTWFCSDKPLIYDTNIKIYNKSHLNPGNLNARVTIPYGFINYDIYDIEPGYMGTVSVSTDQYSVSLSASVRGYYSVLVTDWP